MNGSLEDEEVASKTSNLDLTSSILDPQDGRRSAHELSQVFIFPDYNPPENTIQIKRSKVKVFEQHFCSYKAGDTYCRI